MSSYSPVTFVSYKEPDRHVKTGIVCMRDFSPVFPCDVDVSRFMMLV